MSDMLYYPLVERKQGIKKVEQGRKTEQRNPKGSFALESNDCNGGEL